jgi:D-alanyl-D-alanine carboxypeptidase
MPGCRTPTPSHGGARPQAANSTVGDLMRFAQALGSGTLISRAALAEAISQQQDEYGYGFTVGREPVPNYGHGGGAPGMNGDLRVFPQLGYVLVILSNQGPQRLPASPTSSRSECPTNSPPRMPAGPARG